MKYRACIIASAFLPLLISAPANAASPINRWFCDVAKPPFDVKAAMASFPLEKLPEATTSSKTKGEGDDKNTWVSIESDGEDYEVEYRYAYKNSDVTAPYGFSLAVSSARYDPEFADNSTKWLKEFGTPVKDMLGWRVSTGKPMYAGSELPVYFSAWETTGNYSVNWFYSRDLKDVSELCKKL